MSSRKEIEDELHYLRVILEDLDEDNPWHQRIEKRIKWLEEELVRKS